MRDLTQDELTHWYDLGQWPLNPENLMNTKQVLIGARNLIANVGWCQRSSAVDRAGWRVPYDSPSACGFCIIGAVGRAALDLGGDRARVVNDTLDAIELRLGDAIGGWNDDPHRTKSDVLEMFDTLIESEA